MLVAAWTVHRPNGFFIVKEGWEYNLVLAVVGGGRRGHRARAGSAWTTRCSATTGLYDFLHGWWGLVIAAGLGLAGGIGQLVIFYRPPAKAERS